MRWNFWNCNDSIRDDMEFLFETHYFFDTISDCSEIFCTSEARFWMLFDILFERRFIKIELRMRFNLVRSGIFRKSVIGDA